MLPRLLGFTSEAFWKWADRRQLLSVRSLVMYATIYDTWHAFKWGSEYAYFALDKSGAEVSMVIGAVTAPVAIMQAFVFKWYTETRGEKNVSSSVGN